MKTHTRDKLLAALQTAIAEVDSGLAAGWRKPNGESADGNLCQLRESLIEALQQVRGGTRPTDPGLIGMTKWVVDWVPDLHTPLVQALDTVELQLERAD